MTIEKASHESVVLDRIDGLLASFRPSHLGFGQHGPDAPVMFEQRTSAAFYWLGWKMEQSQVLEMKRIYQRVDHYYSNFFSLLSFILDDVAEASRGGVRQTLLGERIRIDMEKILTDTRSYLDAVYQLVLFLQPPDDIDMAIPKRRRDSFGVFAESYDPNEHRFQPPLSLLCELVPWGLSIRKLRDNYIHNAHQGLVFYGDGELYFDVNLRRRLTGKPVLRTLPNEFYVKDNPNNLIYLEKLIVYSTVPVCALDQALGHYLAADLQTTIEDKSNLTSWRIMPEYYTILAKHRDMLNSAIYRVAYDF